MYKDRFSEIWNQIRGQIIETWGELTEEDLDKIGGVRDLLAGKLQEKYGYSKMEAESEIDSFLLESEAEL